MARAIELAIENVRSGQGGPFGAVIVKDGNIIAEGANQVTSTNDPTAHAEVLAIRQACQKLGTLRTERLRSLYLVRTLPHVPGRDLLGASWLASTSAASRRTRPKLDSTTLLSIAKSLSRTPQRGIPMIQMMREEALAAFRAWREKSPTRYAY